MKLLGVDYGTKRIGLATGDTSSALSFPLTSIEAGDGDDAARAVGEIAVEEGAERIVVGMPYRMTGEGAAGETEELVAGFVSALRKTTGLPVDTEDERLTTALAGRRMREAGMKVGKGDCDAEAAAVILETYMQRAGGREPEN